MDVGRWPLEEPVFGTPLPTVAPVDRLFAAAMKCLATRIGAEVHDVADIRYLTLTHAQDAKVADERYYPLDKVPQKTLFLLEELRE